MSKFLPSFLASVGLCEKKNTENDKETVQGKFVVIVEGFARYLSLAKHLESLPVHSRLFSCDLR